MRQNRKKSLSGFYHVVIRGVNKQNIFYKESDNSFFLRLLEKYSRKYNIKVQAFCLMDNHIHLLIKDEINLISKFVQVVASVYARYFNKKYDRIGHLYQDRFASEVVDDDIYLKTVLRYILQNPVKAKLSNDLRYKWSSYKLYKSQNRFIDKSIIFLFESTDSFYRFINISSDEECLDISLRPSEKTNYFKDKICKLLKTDCPLIKPESPKEEILQKIHLLRQNRIPIRTISRLTGIDKWIVQLA